jgi:hypothetical protein
LGFELINNTQLLFLDINMPEKMVLPEMLDNVPITVLQLPLMSMPSSHLNTMRSIIY